MAEDFLKYFEFELSLIRNAYREFLAGESAQDDDGGSPAVYDDPHMQRLLEGVAFLTAKTEHSLDQQFPELTRSLLQLNYPGLDDIVPAATLLALRPDRESLGAIKPIQKGVRLSPQGKEASSIICSVAADTCLYPFVVHAVQAQVSPFEFMGEEFDSSADVVIRVALEMNDPSATFSSLDLNELDFLIEGDRAASGRMQEILFSRLTNIHLGQGDGTSLGFLDLDSLKPRAFDEDFCFLEKSGNSYLGLQIVKEFFAYPVKQAFVRLRDMGDAVRQCHNRHLWIDFFVKNMTAHEIRAVSDTTFQINVVPIVNQFVARGEPIRYEHTSIRVPVFADANASEHTKISRVDAVFEVTPQGEVEIPRLYSFGYSKRTPRVCWEAQRRLDLRGRLRHEVLFSLPNVDLDTLPLLFSARVICTNGDLSLRYDRLTGWACIDSVEFPGRLEMLTSFSTEMEPSDDEQANWRLLAILNFNFHNIVGSKKPCDALKQFLLLCAPGDLTPTQVSAISKVSISHPVKSLMIQNHNIVSQGTHFAVVIDSKRNRNQYSMLGRLVHHVFLDMCSFDRYVETDVYIEGVAEKVATYGPDHGSQICT